MLPSATKSKIRTSSCFFAPCMQPHWLVPRRQRASAHVATQEDGGRCKIRSELVAIVVAHGLNGKIAHKEDAYAAEAEHESVERQSLGDDGERVLTDNKTTACVTTKMT